MDTDVVVFRKWRDGFGINGGADYHGVIMNTRPANSEESTDLAEELTRSRIPTASN